MAIAMWLLVVLAVGIQLLRYGWRCFVTNALVSQDSYAYMRNERTWHTVRIASIILVVVLSGATTFLSVLGDYRNAAVTFVMIICILINMAFQSQLMRMSDKQLAFMERNPRCVGVLYAVLGMAAIITSLAELAKVARNGL